MMLAMSFLCCIRSDALLVCIVMILIFPTPEYLTAMTWKNCGMPFLSSISLIFFLVLILFGLSSARIRGWTWIMRHRGSAVGSWGVMWVCVGFNGFGKVVWVDFAGAAATAAHDSRELVAIGVACVVRSRGCCHVMWVWF